MKHCSRCMLTKLEEDFYTKDAWCKVCHSNYYKAKSYSKKNKPKQIREDLPNGNRICSRCRQEKSLSDFVSDKRCAGGKSRTCKVCTYSDRDDEIESIRHKQWYEKNKEIVLVKRQIIYEKNCEAKKAYGRQYAKDNPHVCRAAFHKRRLRKIHNGKNDLTSTQVKLLLEHFASCIYCDTVGDKLTIDHIVPLMRGGENTLENVVVACLRCNMKKKTKSIEKFTENQPNFQDKLKRVLTEQKQIIETYQSSKLGT